MQFKTTLCTDTLMVCPDYMSVDLCWCQVRQDGWGTFSSNPTLVPTQPHSQSPFQSGVKTPIAHPPPGKVCSSTPYGCPLHIMRDMLCYMCTDVEPVVDAPLVEVVSAGQRSNLVHLLKITHTNHTTAYACARVCVCVCVCACVCACMYVC